MAETTLDNGNLDCDRAMALLREYTQKPGLIQHALAVEAALAAYARKRGENELAWGLVGLLHDFDYERWPSREDHPFRGAEILERQGYPDWFRRAILSHADYSGVSRDSELEKTLAACDELCGFLVACALVNPARSLHAVKVKSVRKKMKARAFAAAVNRDEIVSGAGAIGVELNDHIEFVLEAMRSVAPALGLAGEVGRGGAADVDSQTTARREDMSNDRRIDYVEFTVPDLDAVKRFYSAVFGWKFTDFGPTYTSFSDGRLNGGFAQSDEPVRSGGALVVLYALDLEAIEAAVEEHGGKIVKTIFKFPGGRRFHFSDPAGSELAVWSDS